MVAKNLTLRIATLDDAEEIATMSRDLIEMGLGWSWTPQRVARNIRNRDTLTLVACESVALRNDLGVAQLTSAGSRRTGQRIIGFAIMYFGDEHAHLNLFAVKPAYQRSGVGGRMLDWLRDSCTVAGIAVVYLELRADNAVGQRFYRGYGFEETGIVPRYYGGVDPARCMALRLRLS